MHTPKPKRAFALFAPFLLAACSATPAVTSEAPVAAGVSDGSVRVESTAAERVVALGRSDNRVQEHLRELCLEIGPRLTGSSNLQRSAEWARAQFGAWGLEARLESWGEVPVGFDRGPWSGRIVSPEPVELEFTTMAWTPGTDGPARGWAVPYPEDDEELAALEPRMAGVWVVRPSGERAVRRERKEAGEWRARVEEAMAASGALGEVRSSGSELVHTGGNYRVEWDDLPTKVSIVLRSVRFDELARSVEEGVEVELEFDVDNRFFEGPVTQYNVVADLIGTERPDEYVIVCGHLDSWDGAEGAVDNGTGVATAMEAARLLAAADAYPARTIRFILWSGEEQGLLGSRAYVAAHPELMPAISAVLNHDGGTNFLAGLAVTPEMMLQMSEACAPLVDLEADMPFELTERDGLPGGGSSDHAPFVRAGVPGFFWDQSGRSDYNFHHHTQHDHFDAAISEYQEHSAVVVALAAYGLANLDELLERSNMEPIPPRRMGVQLDGTVVRRIFPDTKAAAAGWQADDTILTVDGAEVAGTRDVVDALQRGGPMKTVELDRDGERVESVLDYSGDEAEVERARRREEREAARAAGEQG